MLEYTQQPLVDVGIATLVVLAKRPHPQALTATDLNAWASWLGQSYLAGPLRRLGHGVAFLNPGYSSSPDPAKQQAYVERVLFSWQQAPRLAEACAFCGRGAAYRASREEMPLLNGRAVGNFGGRGQAGVPICGTCSLAIQALPVGCLKSSRAGLLAVHSPDPAVLQALTGQIVRRNLSVFSLLSVEAQLPSYPYAGTRLLELLLEWLQTSQRSTSAPLTGYFFNNGKSPFIQLLQLSSGVVSFLRQALYSADPTLVQAWHQAVGNAWDKEEMRNRLYEGLLDLPRQERPLLHRHLLPTRHWGLVSLFLRSLNIMPPEKIALLRRLGERFAAYAHTHRAFRFAFSRTDEYSQWRRGLLRAADDYSRQHGETLITFDEFVQAFTAPPGEINDWRLARDLVTLVMLEGVSQEEEALFESEEE